MARIDELTGIAPEVAEETAYAFSAPPGFTAPDDVQEGDAFEVVAKVRLQGGQLVFDQINGVALGGDEPEEAEPEVVEEEEITETEDEPMGLMQAARESGY
jgi:ATP phosphoribosyltransferase regulatory subunit HisZ